MKRDQKYDRLKFSSLWKILINHLQYLAFLRHMNFTWENYMFEFFEIQALLADITQSTSSIDCIIKREFDFPGLYFKTLFFAIFPYLVFLLISLWTFSQYQKNEWKTTIIIIYLISLDILLPSLINSMIESLTCFQFEGVYYLRKDMSHECYTHDHFLKVNLIR